jgi:sec-independent protein translocase protein TatB
MSFWELLVILIVALVVIKPERMPEIAYMIGKGIARIRRWYHNALQKIMNIS